MATLEEEAVYRKECDLRVGVKKKREKMLILVALFFYIHQHSEDTDGREGGPTVRTVQSSDLDKASFLLSGVKNKQNW